MSLQRPQEACEQLELAFAARSTPATPAIERARTAYALAKALVQSGGDVERATALARQAEAAYAEAGSKHDKERAAVAEWLAARDAPPGRTPGPG
jgi:protein involved in temperature-dependent protein secretion